MLITVTPKHQDSDALRLFKINLSILLTGYKPQSMSLQSLCCRQQAVSINVERKVTQAIGVNSDLIINELSMTNVHRKARLSVNFRGTVNSLYLLLDQQCNRIRDQLLKSLIT